METLGFILGSAGLSFALLAHTQVEALKKEVKELKQSLGRSAPDVSGDSGEANN